MDCFSIAAENTVCVYADITAAILNSCFVIRFCPDLILIRSKNVSTRCRIVDYFSVAAPIGITQLISRRSIFFLIRSLFAVTVERLFV